MPYSPTYGVGGWLAGTTTPVTATALNDRDQQYLEATNSFEQDLLTAFVLSGLVSTKDGTTASQLDVTTGVAFLKQSDNTLRRRAPAATNFSAAGNPSATLYLDLNPDGSWSWGTAHSAQANYLTVCTVTTDASSNIATVTDTRTTYTALFSGMAGVVRLNKLYSDAGAITSDGGGNLTVASINTGAGAITASTLTVTGAATLEGYIQSLQSGAASGISFRSWDGSASHVPFSIGGQFNGAQSWVDSSGSTWTPEIVFTPSHSGQNAYIQYYDPAASLEFVSPQAGAATGHLFATWTGSAQRIAFSIGGPFGGAPAWIDNNGALVATGTLVWGPGVNGAHSYVSYDPANYTNDYFTPQAGPNALSHQFVTWNGSAQKIPFAIGNQVFAASYVDNNGYIHVPVVQSTTSYLGFKDASGNKLAEFAAGGQLRVAAGNPSFVSTSSTVGYAASAAFDSFDVSEVYETDGAYKRGTVLCPGPNGKLTRCTHDKCRAALIVSTGGAVNIGGRMSDDEDYDPNVHPMALVGRVLVDTDSDIPAFAEDGQPTLVCTNGRGGVRAMRPGESGFALGYTLTDAREGQVGIVVRPLFCQA